MEHPHATSAPSADPADLAQSLGFITEMELCRLGKIAPATAEAWRKRGLGPAFIRFGNVVLYPRKDLAEYLQAKARGSRGNKAQPLI